eukprot:3570448-Alexandrium_andersonii.AAC.1
MTLSRCTLGMQCCSGSSLPQLPPQMSATVTTASVCCRCPVRVRQMCLQPVACLFAARAQT